MHVWVVSDIEKKNLLTYLEYVCLFCCIYVGMYIILATFFFVSNFLILFKFSLTEDKKLVLVLI